MLRDLLGNIAPLGKTFRKLEANFLESQTLPPWITVTGAAGSAGTIVTPDVDCYGLHIDTGVNANDATNINIMPNGFKFGDAVGSFREAILEIDSFHVSHGPSNVRVYVGIGHNTAGTTIKQLMQQIDLKRATGGTTTLNTSFQLDQARKTNVKVHIRCDRTIAIYEGDIIAYEIKPATSLVDIAGVFKPVIVIQTLTAGAKWARMARIALTLVHN